MLLSSGDNCEDTSTMARFIFSFTMILELHILYVIFKLLLASLKHYRVSTSDQLDGLSSVQRHLRRRAQACRLFSCMAGAVANLLWALLNFLFFLKMVTPGVKGFPMVGWLNTTKAWTFLVLTFLVLSLLTLCAVYGYILQVAESNGFISKKLARGLSAGVLLLSFISTLVAILTSWATHLMLGLGAVVKLGRMVGDKVHTHSFFTDMIPNTMPEDDRGMRMAALKYNLTAFTREMERLVFIGILFLITTIVLDSINDLVPAQFVALVYGAALFSTYAVQRKVVGFLRPRASENIVQWLAALNAEEAHQGFSARNVDPSGSVVLAVNSRACSQPKSGKGPASRVVHPTDAFIH